MGRYLLLWLLGIPLPILVPTYAFGGWHDNASCSPRVAGGSGRSARESAPIASPGLRNYHKKGGPLGAAFSVIRLRHQPPLPPITARTVSSGPKSSAPST